MLEHLPSMAFEMTLQWLPLVRIEPRSSTAEEQWRYDVPGGSSTRSDDVSDCTSWM